MITHQDKISIMLTFSVGFITGFYFYFTGFSFEFTSNFKEQDFYQDFLIEGQAYGGCEITGCLSFQLLADGTYKAFIYNSKSEEIKKSGVLDLAMRKELMRNLSKNELKKYTVKDYLGDECVSDSGGVDYSISVTRDGGEYKLDTCSSFINKNSKSWQSLSKLIDYFESL